MGREPFPAPYCCALETPVIEHEQLSRVKIHNLRVPAILAYAQSCRAQSHSINASFGILPCSTAKDTYTLPRRFA